MVLGGEGLNRLIEGGEPLVPLSPSAALALELYLEVLYCLIPFGELELSASAPIFMASNRSLPLPFHLLDHSVFHRGDSGLVFSYLGRGSI